MFLELFFWATNFMNWKNFENTTFFVRVCFFFGVGGFKPCWFHGSVEVFRSPEKKKKHLSFFSVSHVKNTRSANVLPPSFRRGGHGSFPEEQVALWASRGMCDQFGQDFFSVRNVWDILGMFQEVIITWLVNGFFNLPINGVFVGVK